MKLLYFGNDQFANCLDVFVQRGFEVLCLWVNPQLGNAQQISAKAKNLGIPIETGKPDLVTLNGWIEAGAELFFSADYQHLIPLPPNLGYGVNLHMTLLPEGRGATPLPYLIQPHRAAAGLTLHELSDGFDTGAILLQEKLTVSDDDTLSSLQVKIHLAAAPLLTQFLADVRSYFAAKQAQGEGSYWQQPHSDQQLLDWRLSASDLNERIQRFGHFGLLILLNHEFWRVLGAKAHPYAHNHAVGQALFEDAELLAVTCADGFVTLPKRCIVALGKGD